MITFDGITRKWRFYRNTIVTCFFLNVLCVMTGLALGVDFWHSALQREESQERLFGRLESADRLQNAILNLKASESKNLVLDLENWSEVKVQLRELGWPELPASTLSAPQAKSQFLTEIESKLRSQKAEWITKARTERKHESHVVRLLMLVAALSILFGLLLPLYCFARIAKILVKTKDDLQKAAQAIVADWLKAAHRFGEEPFRNIEFWLHIVLIAASYIGEASRHPAAQVAGELAHLVRRELKKNGVAFEGDIRPRA